MPIRRLLIAVWFLWLIALAGSFAVEAGWGGLAVGGARNWRLASSALLVAAAWLASFGLKEARDRSTANWIDAGMFFGFLGDLAMGAVIALPFLPDRTLNGMLFFGVGHLCYCAAALSARRRLGLPGGARWWGAIAAWQLVNLALWWFVVAGSGKKEALHFPALGYGALLAATAGLMTGLALLDRRFAWAALGAALFLFSDGVIAAQLFQNAGKWSGPLVWATYGPGQMLIVYGFAWALRSQPVVNGTT